MTRTHHICSNTAEAELTMGSNTPPTDSTYLRVTMQHKSGTAWFWHDRFFLIFFFQHPDGPNNLPEREPLLMAFTMSLQATLWRSAIIHEMIICWHP